MTREPDKLSQMTREPDKLSQHVFIHSSIQPETYDGTPSYDKQDFKTKRNFLSVFVRLKYMSMYAGTIASGGK